MSPSNGTAVDTEFTFRADLFTDDVDDFPLKYKFGYVEIQDDGEEVETYLGFQNPQKRKRTKLAQGLFDRQSRNLTFVFTVRSSRNAYVEDKSIGGYQGDLMFSV